MFINFDGARNVSLFHHEVAHLLCQDAEGDGFVPLGYGVAARDDGTLDAFRRGFPARARFFEEQLARPRAPRADGTW